MNERGEIKKKKKKKVTIFYFIILAFFFFFSKTQPTNMVDLLRAYKYQRWDIQNIQKRSNVARLWFFYDWSRTNNKSTWAMLPPPLS